MPTYPSPSYALLSTSAYLHLFICMITFSYCCTMSKAPKCRGHSQDARMYSGHCLIIGPLFWESPLPGALSHAKRMSTSSGLDSGWNEKIGKCFFIRCTPILWLLQVPFEELNIVQTNYYYPSTRGIVAITNNLTRKTLSPLSDGINCHSVLNSHHILCRFLIIHSEVPQRIYQPDHAVVNFSL